MLHGWRLGGRNWVITEAAEWKKPQPAPPPSLLPPIVRIHKGSQDKDLIIVADPSSVSGAVFASTVEHAENLH
ncbi:hypothetical protein ANO14919_066090 [Xylariales sp. No.14919]|nr:hypothetical protein ANO14919_066090 [Xylariales sp. No.14919]